MWLSPHRKRHRPEGEGKQPLAPHASTVLESGVRSNYRKIEVEGVVVVVVVVAEVRRCLQATHHHSKNGRRKGKRDRVR